MGNRSRPYTCIRFTLLSADSPTFSLRQRPFRSGRMTRMILANVHGGPSVQCMLFLGKRRDRIQCLRRFSFRLEQQHRIRQICPVCLLDHLAGIFGIFFAHNHDLLGGTEGPLCSRQEEGVRDRRMFYGFPKSSQLAFCLAFPFRVPVIRANRIRLQAATELPDGSAPS